MGNAKPVWHIVYIAIMVIAHVPLCAADEGEVYREVSGCLSAGCRP